MFLHIIPERDMAAAFAGTYKDVVSRANWLKTRFPEYLQVLIADDKSDELDAVLSDGVEVEGALVEYSYHSQIVKYLKTRFPNSCVAVRSINIEPLQYFDNTGWNPERGPLWMLYGMARLFKKEVENKRYADVVLSINEWENQVYWKWLPGKARIEWLPYRCPDYLLPKNPTLYLQRKVIACLPTSQKNRISWDLVTRFQKLAAEMKRLGSQDDFIVTGKLRDWGLPECRDVTYAGFVDNLAELEGTCKVIVMLSPLGYGFKTTISDALAAGAHVIAHPKLIRRCPTMIRPFILPLDTDHLSGLPAVMAALQQKPKGTELHDALCKRADAVLSRWFGETAG